MTSLSATIASITIVGDAGEKGTFGQGLGILKARISLLGATGQHAEYLVKVKQGSNFYTISKRFSEFADLHNFLVARFGPNLPVRLPGKTPIRYFNEDKLEYRRNILNKYLEGICSRPEYLSCPDVLKFFDPRVLGTMKNPSDGGVLSTLLLAAMGSAPLPAPNPINLPTRLAVKKGTNGRHDSEDNLVGWDN